MRSKVTGRYMRASRQIADRLDVVDAGLQRGFDALRPLEAVLRRAASDPLGPKDIPMLDDLHAILWSALEKLGDDLDEVRALLGVSDA